MPARRAPARSAQLERERGPPALPVDAGVERRALHLHGLDEPEAGMAEAESDMAPGVRSRADGLIRIVFAHRHHQDARGRLAAKEKRERQRAAAAHRVRILARQELEGETER